MDFPRKVMPMIFIIDHPLAGVEDSVRGVRLTNISNLPLVVMFGARPIDLDLTPDAEGNGLRLTAVGVVVTPLPHRYRIRVGVGVGVGVRGGVDVSRCIGVGVRGGECAVEA